MSTIVTSSTPTSHRREGEKGIVLGLENDTTIRVWSPKHPLNEIKFKDYDKQFNPGDFVRFKLVEPIDLDRVQQKGIIGIEEAPHTITVIDRDDEPSIWVKVEIGVPPIKCNYFTRDMFESGIDCRVAFFCYNREFGKIASYHPLDCKPGRFYKAIIGRIIGNHWQIPRIGTIFTLVNQTLEEIIDPNEIARISKYMPWNAPGYVDEIIVEVEDPPQLRNRNDRLSTSSNNSCDTIENARRCGYLDSTVGDLLNLGTDENPDVPTASVSNFLNKDDGKPRNSTTISNASTATFQIPTKDTQNTDLFDLELNKMFIDFNRNSNNNGTVEQATTSTKANTGCHQKYLNDFGDEIIMEPNEDYKHAGMRLRESGARDNGSHNIVLTGQSAQNGTHTVGANTTSTAAENVSFEPKKIASIVTETLSKLESMDMNAEVVHLQQQLMGMCLQTQEDMIVKEKRAKKERT